MGCPRLFELSSDPRTCGGLTRSSHHRPTNSSLGRDRIFGRSCSSGLTPATLSAGPRADQVPSCHCFNLVLFPGVGEFATGRC